MSIATPGRVSPVQWVHAFSYTPDSTPSHNTSRRPARAESREDALPTQFQVQAVYDAVSPGLDIVPGEGSDAHYISDPVVVVPTKRKRRGKGKGIPLLVNNLDDVRTNSRPSSQQCARLKTQSSTRAKSESVMGANSSPPTPCPSLSNPHSRPRSRCFTLDEVEITTKRGSRLDCRTTVYSSSTESAHKSASTYYPSPPISRARKDTTIDDTTSLVIHSVSPSKLTIPLKMSKYFKRTSTSPTRLGQGNVPVSTLPSLPRSIIPQSVESSYFEYPPRTVLLDKPSEKISSDLVSLSLQENNPGLSDDFMIMLRRLKPILIQESVSDDPWKVLIAVRLLNVTTGKAAIPVFCKIISRWPTPQDLAHASQDQLIELLRPLGLYNKRARWLKGLSQRVFEDQQELTSDTPWDALLSETGMVSDAHRYPGVGPYALDSLRIFCARDKDAWMRVMPQDKELIRYLRWRWAVEKSKVWYPEGIGVIRDVDLPCLISLVDELATHYDDTIGGEGYMYHFYNDLGDTLNGNMAE